MAKGMRLTDGRRTLFRLGDRVATRRVGPPVVGEVRGFLLPFDVDWTPDDGLDDVMRLWSEHYPDWRKHPLVFIAVDLTDADRADEPEFVRQRMIAYPIDDLEAL